MKEKFYREKVYRAGFIAYYVNDPDDLSTIEIKVMKPADQEYGGDQFQLVKGKIEEGESAISAAIREAREEIGLFESNLEFIEDFGLHLGRTYVYIGRVTDKEHFGMHDINETEETAWMTETKFLEFGRPLHKDLMRQAFSRFREIEENKEYSMDH